MNKKTNDKIIDVLIIGAGPAGTALAIDLQRRGLNIRIVDKAPTSFEGSRAKGVQPRTLEVFQDLGLVKDVLQAGSLYPLLGVHLGPLVIPWRMMSKRAPSSDVPFPNVLLIPQFSTDAALHARFESLGGVVEYGKQFVSLSQIEDYVIVNVEGADGVVEEISARYMVGADGGSSKVRQQLGIKFAGSTIEEDRIIIVDGVTTGLSRNRWHIWPGKSGQFIAACPLPHSELFQWMIRIAPDEQPELELSAINARIQKRIANLNVVLSDIRWKSVFRPNIRMAEHYRSGRVFLTGDAGHVHTPAGAQGLNTGIQDSYNLGWKLAQVLAGADSGLLDSYEAERWPIAASVLALSTKKYDGIAKLDPSSIRRGKDETQLTLTYRNGPLALNSSHTPTLQAGDRAPDANLTAVHGGNVCLFDIFQGPQFTVIGFGAYAAQVVNALEWSSNGAGLKRVLINVDSTHSADYVLKDSEQAFSRAYGITGDIVILIRPDGYIGHMANPEKPEKLKTYIKKITPR
ncbi:FAD-dependent oxidoreductase [Aquirhabdus parva]|uniref:Alkyl hydroperoxide reductase subunit F n=1 Tax=Aquirhabdus parva TaxID=2283318 RepID=A0A345P563_9GAMM|nr:FAD-dependent oxidoreductase [Aquirhabdus parva]AXI02422.1 FAD-binding protein [Aquirhabdus parva]